ncbi:MAG: cold-shock protein [Acidimicrobiales bacterium]
MSRGRVVDFDEDKGMGHVEAIDGRRLFFHCTSIADGSRTIPVDAQVAFRIVPGHVGELEAIEIERLPRPGGA